MVGSRSRGAFVRVLAGFLTLLLVLPGPMEAIARAEAARQVARDAMRRFGKEIDPEPAKPPSNPPKPSAPITQAAKPAAILPVPLRPAELTWLSPVGGAHDPWALFDGRASTGLESSTSEQTRIAVRLESTTALAAVTVLGPADGALTVFASEGDALRPLEALADVPVHARAGEWKRFATTDGARLDRLVLQWTPSGGAGPTEIGLWGLGLPERDATDAELADRILSNAAPGAATFAAGPAEARLVHVGPSAGAASGPGHATAFHATLTADPRSLARAFLVYELTGLGQFTEPPRQINGLAVRGGTTSADRGEGGLQVEEIAPEWLRLGDNEVRFLPLAGDGAPDYGVRRVRIVGTPRAAVREARMTDAFNGNRPGEQRLAFEAPSQPHDVVFEVLRPSDGALILKAPGDKGKHPVRIDLHGLDVGWHRADLGGLPVSDAIGISLDRKAKKALGQREDRLPTPAVSEVAVTTSEIPQEADDQRIVVTYPLHGECVDHRARVRGFVSVPAGAGGVESLRVGGRVAEGALASDASFEVVVPESASAAGGRWEVPLEATLGDGDVLRRAVAIEPCVDRPGPGDDSVVADEGAPFAEVVRAGEAKTIAFAGAKLDIPAGAVDKDVRITVRPLVADQVPPMDARMANVSGDGRAFRFGPHGLKFKKPVKITLPYDPATFRPGMRERDIVSFYYDRTQEKWSRIGRYGMPAGGELTSLTEHFTDFVNATLAMPDEPGPRSFDQNEMKGIKVASPSTGIDLIAPPEANGSGTVRLSHSIELPPGRNGVEPELAFGYDSERRNGWLGVGWDLTVSSIEIDTRFGVPQYQGKDLYAIDGEQLTPKGGGLFQRRVEGRFEQIQQNVDPSNATCIRSWTVTDKRGTVYTYGSSVSSNPNTPPTSAAVLSDPGDPTGCRAFRWGLTSVEDTFGNLMTVSYVVDGGTSPGGQESFTALYPQEIDYTAHVPAGSPPSTTPDLPAPYKVLFARDARGSRPDPIVNGRPGFQERTDFRLDHVDVQLQTGAASTAQIIRRYQLAYANDVPTDASHFHKSLLSSIALQGVPSGTTPPQSLVPATQLDQHTFDYQATQTTGSGPQQAFSSPQPWGTVFTGSAPGQPRTADGISRTDDSFQGVTGDASISFLGLIGVGGSGTISGGDDTVGLSMLDLNGDGLPDVIDSSGTASLGLLNASASNHTQFLSIGNMGSLGHTNQSSWSAGGSISGLSGVFGASASYTHTTADDDHLLADIDGDGFPDLVTISNGQATWQRNDIVGTGRAGDLVGTQAFDPTARSLGDLSSIQIQRSRSDLYAGSAATALRRINPVLRWTAPYTGVVNFGGTLQKIAKGGNGVTASVYVNPVLPSSTPQWQHPITANDTSTCVPTGTNGCTGSGLSISVSAGDRIYTTLTPNHDPSAPASTIALEGVGNNVLWNPTINYTSVNSSSVSAQQLGQREPYGPLIYSFVQKSDHRIFGRPNQQWLGTQGQPSQSVFIQGNIAMGANSDDAVFHIKLNGSDISGFPVTIARTGGTSSVGTITLTVNPNDVISFEISSDSPIDPGQILWNPQVQYHTYCLGSTCGTVTCNTAAGTCTIDSDPQKTVIPITAITKTPAPFYPVPQLLPPTPTPTLQATTSGSVTMSGKVQVSDPATVLVQTVTSAGASGVPFKVNALSGQTIDLSSVPSFSVNSGDQIFVTVFSTTQQSSPPVNLGVSASIAGGGAQGIQLNTRWQDTSFDGSFFGPIDNIYLDGTYTQPVPADPMSGGFHRWFAGFFDGEEPFSEEGILFPPASSVFSPALLGQEPIAPFNPGVSLPQPIGSSPGSMWAGPTSGSYIAAGQQGTTRFGLDGSSAGGGTGGLGSLRSATTWDFNYGASAGIPVGDSGLNISLSGGGGEGETNTELDFFDFNGDRIPDAVTLGGVAFSNAGFQMTSIPNLSVDALRRVEHRAVRGSAGVGGSDKIVKMIQRTDTAGNPKDLLTIGFNSGVDYSMSGAKIDWIDVNGDGLPDLVQRDISHGAQPYSVQLNYGYALSHPIPWSAAAWTKQDVGGINSGFLGGLTNFVSGFGTDVGVDQIRLMDNASKSVSLGGGVSIGDDGGVDGGAGNSSGIGRTFVDLIDVNGDGMPDQVMKVPGEAFLHVRLNLGDHFDTNEIHWSLPTWASANIKEIPPGSDWDFLQIGSNNGDIDDSLQYRRSRTNSYNFGAKFCFPIGPFITCIGASYFNSSSNGAVHTGFQDVDGDGYVDQVAKVDGDPTGLTYVKLNLAGQTNLLTGVHRPFGGNFTIGYARQGNLVNHAASQPVDEPSNLFVMSHLDVDDGRNNHYIRSFQYNDSGFHDRVERDDYGFGKVIATRGDPVTLAALDTVETDRQNQDFYRKGLTSKTLTRDSVHGNVLFTVQSFSYATPPQAALDASGSVATPGSFFPFESSRTTDHYEGSTSTLAPTGGAPVSTSQTRQWDTTNGDLLQMVDQGDTGLSNSVTYTILYNDPNLAGTHIFKPSEVIACSSAPCNPGGSNVLRDRKATYNTNGSLATLTNVVIGGADPITGAPYTGGASSNQTWLFPSYDAFGNVLQEQSPPGPLDGNQGYTLNYVYDGVAQTYRIQMTDSFPYMSSAVYDLRFGTAASQTDINGNTVVFTRDAFGRLVTIDAPGDPTPANEHTIAFAYSEQGSSPPASPGGTVSNPLPAFATTAHRDAQHAGDPIVTASFVDGLNRVIQTKKDLVKTTGGGTGTTGMSVSGTFVFDAFGRVSQQGQPTFSASTNATAFVPGTAVNPTLFTYDVLDRVTQVQTPDGATTTTTFSFDMLNGTRRLATFVKDPNVNAGAGLPGTVHESFRGVRDIVLAIEETNRLNGSTPTSLLTQYAYDPLDEVVRVTDAKGNVTSATYDTRGRVVALSSPDTGLTTYSYDKAGNLGAKQTANLRAQSQSITYQYNFNRLQQVTYPVSKPVVYTYGAPSEVGEANFNVGGRIKQETSEAGTKTYEYDTLGNISQQSWSLFEVDNEDDTFTATMAYSYDPFGRLLTMSFPGRTFQETVAYGYDAGGSVTTAIGMDQKGNVTNYLLGIGYDEFEQRENLVSGNGIKTTYSYYPLTRRLQNVNASELDPELVEDKKPPRPFQQMVYNYDLAGNITQIQNNAPFDPQELGQVQVGKKTENFTYDDLYQLKTASGFHQPSSEDTFTYGLNFTYDAIGNITQKAQTSASQELDLHGNVLLNQTNQQQTYTSSYTYAGPRPHAPTEIDDTVPLQQQPQTRALTYDADGNQVQWVKQKVDKRVVTFDEENRITFVQENGLEQYEVNYDGAGQRAVKQANALDQTAYFGPNLTLRDGQFSTKNIFAGDTRIAARLDPENDGDGPVLYFHDDHLGSTNFLTDSQQNLQAHEEYFPSGELWIDETSDPQHTQVPYLFTGKELDTETNLYYFGARYYDPRLSTWTSPDTVLVKYLEQINHGQPPRPEWLLLYQYAENDPIRQLDVGGRDVIVNGMFEPRRGEVRSATVPVNRGVTRSPVLIRFETKSSFSPRMNKTVSDIDITVTRQPSTTTYNPRTDPTIPDQYVPGRSLAEHEEGHYEVSKAFFTKGTIDSVLAQVGIFSTITTSDGKPSRAEAARQTRADTAKGAAITRYLQQYERYLQDRILHKEATAAGDRDYAHPAAEPEYIDPETHAHVKPSAEVLEWTYRAIGERVKEFHP